MAVLMATVPDRPALLIVIELAPAVKVCAVLKLDKDAGT